MTLTTRTQSQFTRPRRKRISLATFIPLLCFALLTGGANSDEGPQNRPNIVFLMTDDQPAGAVGCYGNKDVITPNLDSIARDGIRFQNHYVTSAICMASRSTVLTGLYEYRHGCNFERGNLERRFLANSYPAQLRAAGYYTGFAGKIGFDLEGEPFDHLEREFDEWAGGPGQTEYETIKNKGIAKYADRYPHCSRAYAAWAADFLKAAKRSGRPFCMSISFKAPHLPFRPDPLDLARYERKTEFARPANYGMENGRHLSPQSQTSRAATSYREWITKYDETAKLYYALITGVDEAVGMIRRSLEGEGLSENTIIIFTSDNGYNCGAHGFGDKVLPYEEASKVPLIIYDPRTPREKRGEVRTALTANVDISPTIVELAGIPNLSEIDGKSLVPVIAEADHSVRASLPLFNFWGIKTAQSMAIVTPHWKYIYWYHAGPAQPAEELFQIAQDKLEMQNLIANPEYAEELAHLRREYDNELARLRNNANPTHGYPLYGILFDRTVPFDQKSYLVAPR
ncbi:sulfatase [Schlesneria sp. T3-172]|uniref:sulfatase family protein n=1 Tax=Schlesneria sphaerica TaxID=3373610 RepID=UPI0037C9FA8F